MNIILESNCSGKDFQQAKLSVGREVIMSGYISNIITGGDSTVSISVEDLKIYRIEK